MVTLVIKSKICLAITDNCDNFRFWKGTFLVYNLVSQVIIDLDTLLTISVNFPSIMA